MKPDPPASLPCMLSVLDVLQAAALMIHREGTVVHANRRLCQLIDRTQDELICREWAELYKPEDRDEIRDRVRRWQPNEGESFLPRRDGHNIPVIYSASPLNGHPDYAIVTIVDMTARDEFEKRLREQYQEVARLSDTVIEQALDLKGYSSRLEERVAERTQELHDAHLDTIYMLAVASEARDEDTGAHVRRVEQGVVAIARQLGIAAHEAGELGRSAILHDVGKIHVPDQILKKPGKLTEEEFRQMQEHTIAGERILSDRPFFEEARRIARSHHENWDGSGYPDGLTGKAIPLSARIVRVVDVYDALTHDRVYKSAWSREEAHRFIRENAGKMFDEEVVDALLRVED